MGLLLLVVASSAALCWVYLRLARRLQILDQPNDRSSHRRATPHGGGAALMLALALGVALAPLWYGDWRGDLVTLLVIALALSVLGILDDLINLPMSLRLALYTLASALACWLVLSPGAGQFLSPAVFLLAVVAVLWLLNLYNFMDGIDGIAAIQCFLACCGAALLSWSVTGGGDYTLFCLLLAASQLGFLFWNWPPARLFMGDAGSIPTGFLLGSLALMGQASGALPLSCWLILLACFITDASWTLVWRIATGQRFFEAHRSHAYQQLAQRWNSHLAVDFLLLVINGLWLFPLAWAALLWPGLQAILVILAFLPLLAGMAILSKIA